MRIIRRYHRDRKASEVATHVIICPTHQAPCKPNRLVTVEPLNPTIDHHQRYATKLSMSPAQSRLTTSCLWALQRKHLKAVSHDARNARGTGIAPEHSVTECVRIREWYAGCLVFSDTSKRRKSIVSPDDMLSARPLECRQY